MAKAKTPKQLSKKIGTLRKTMKKLKITEKKVKKKK